MEEIDSDEEMEVPEHLDFLSQLLSSLVDN